ncbi:hypothetical protein CP556_00550 [Natrinema sp. CBA1119]|uniref:hypothetical protein n=1 Tax=Natrinema sp. CBA1119 TaxID=1608465 RepID=UPI000BFAA560|nr:hypothetical protein [Natrinema sp. CBA1119]PGF14754.1 hypothetical protein CP556_00550 [Natrinema sp. CBA1119]
MTRPSRRTLLGSTATLIGLSAGCIADGTGSPTDDDDDRDDADEGSPAPDSNESDPKSVGEDGDIEDLPNGVAGYRTLAYQYGSSSTESDVGLLRDADDAANWLEERSPSDTESLDEFVDETDFETSILVSLESTTPTPCYEIDLESIDVVESDGEDDTGTDGDDESEGGGDDDGTDELVLEAAVRDTSAEDEVCAQSIATVGRLVRVTFETEPLTTISATIVGHDGSTSSVSMASDSASASESTSVDSASGSGSDS